MTSIYYEKHLTHPDIHTKELIKLSESRRMFHKNTNQQTTDNYLQRLSKLIRKLRYDRVQLQTHPTFDHNNHESTNWMFELIHVKEKKKQLLLQSLEGITDLKEKNRMLLDALRVSNDITRDCASLLFVEHDMVSCLNYRFHLSTSFSLAADRFFNMYKFKTNFIAVKKAYQLKELASLLWNHDYTQQLITYKAYLLLEMAKKLSDDDCGERVALLERVVHDAACPEEVQSMHATWKQQNDQVYYKLVASDKRIETISLEAAFQTLTAQLAPVSTA